ncbi:hypothetical protein [Parendozoicomonas sp. Alg238-R29]|uniref:hypothetical protein n=1 Tax=Parendozoicomonas sp. Alg238-R29 TaxID=2993446 RepID=UPI00248E5B78|nr:hypothetical protein [Parendozoicomonas sp. Alg238-R29]
MQHPSKILQSFRERAKWPVMSQILKKSGFSPARGWDNNIERFQEQEDTDREAAANASEQLVCDYKNYIRFGQKSIRLYQLEPQLVADIQQALDSLQIPESGYSTSYPLPLSEEDLEECSEAPVYVDRVLSSKGTDYIFSSCRKFQERRVFDQEILNDNALQGEKGSE